MTSRFRCALRLLPGLTLALNLLAASAAESHEAFASRVARTKGATATVNLRQDNSFGAITITLVPELVADRAALDPLLAQIGEFAAGRQLRATVATPRPEDAEFIVARLGAAGVTRLKTQAMADFVSIRMTRIFLSPGS